jgi:hypothetical protein
MYPGRSVFRKHENESRGLTSQSAVAGGGPVPGLPGDTDFGTQTITLQWWSIRSWTGSAGHWRNRDSARASHSCRSARTRLLAKCG